MPREGIDWAPELQLERMFGMPNGDKEREPVSARRVLEALYEFAEGGPDRFDSMSEAEIIAYLRKEGRDVDNLRRKAKEFLKRLQGRARLSTARDRWNRAISAVRDIMDISEMSMDEVKVEVEKRLGSRTAAGAALEFHRDLSELSDDDWRRKLDDLLLLEALSREQEDPDGS